MKTFELTDLALVSFLRLNNFTIKDIKWDGRRATFILEDKPTRQKLIKDFYNNDVSIPPLQFWNSVAEVKTLIYNY